MDLDRVFAHTSGRTLWSRGSSWWLLAVVCTTGACSVEPPCDRGGPECPAFDDLAGDAHLREAYHLYDRTGAPLADVGGVLRDWTPTVDIPGLVRKSWVAVEDRRFHEHGGVDVRGVLRAALTNLRSGEVAEGASTIAMQLARVLWPEATASMSPWSRKAFEARMARRLVAELGRERVLELYLNGIYLGDGRYGVQEAARHYFDSSLDSLDLAETATLVGMTKTPERYHPARHPDRAKERRNVVLDILAREGVVSPEEAEKAKQQPLQVQVEGEVVVPRTRSYVTAAVRRELSLVAPEWVGRPGLEIHTNIDPAAQAQVSERVRRHLARIEDGAFGEYLGEEEETQAGAVVLETQSGQILAIVGGRSFSTSEFNRALQAKRPVGSLAKPFILAAALEGGVRPTRALSTEDLEVETPEGVWNPRDHVDSDFLFPHDMVALSSNRAAVRLGQEVGIGRFIETAARLGVESPIAPYPASWLGSFEASLVEMTSAFAAFENGGLRVRPHLIRLVTSGRGDTVWTRPGGSRPERVLEEATAHQVLDALQGVVRGGTGWRAGRRLDGPAAGKTGTTNDGRDAWFIGLRPGIAAGVWIGFDDPRPVVEGGSGGLLAAPLWSDLMIGTEGLGWGQGDWDADPSLVRVRLALQSLGDTIAPCWGRGARPALVREVTLDEIDICDPSPRWGSGGDLDGTGPATWRAPIYTRPSLLSEVKDSITAPSLPSKPNTESRR